MDNDSGGKSWYITWAIGLHARLHDGDTALQSAILFLALWVHPELLRRIGRYFQMDGNLGITSALLEMMLQGHAGGVIHIDSTLPTTRGMMTGSLKGFAARGGCFVDMAWEVREIASGSSARLSIVQH